MNVFRAIPESLRIRTLFVLIGLLGMTACGTVMDQGSPLVGYPALDRYERKLIERPDGSYLECYVTRSLEDEPLPLVFFCQGSGYYSMFQTRISGDLIDLNLWFLMESRYSRKVRFAFVEKWGVRFGSAALDPTEDELPFDYLLHDLLAHRVQDTLWALEELCKDPGVDRSRVALLGHGQGALVAASAARLSPDATHLGYFAAGGMPRLQEMMIQKRRSLAADKDLEAEDIELKMAGYILGFAGAFASPKDCETRYHGITAAQLASYGKHEPMENLLKLDLPIFVAAGGADRFVPLESIDLIRLEFLRLGKRNLSLRVYSGMDHGFNRRQVDEAGDRTESRFAAVFDEFCDWFLEDYHPRDEE
jgi:predicted esterase